MKSSTPADTVTASNKPPALDQNTTQKQAQSIVKSIDKEKIIKKAPPIKLIDEPIVKQEVEKEVIVKEVPITGLIDEPIVKQEVKKEEIVKDVLITELIDEPIVKQEVEKEEIVKEVPITELIGEPIVKQEVKKEEIVKDAPITELIDEPIVKQEVEKEVIVKDIPTIEPITKEILATNKAQIKDNSVKKKISVKNQDSSTSDSINELASLIKSDNHLFKQPILKTGIGKKWGLARHYFSQKKYSKAEKEYIELIALEPSYADFYGELSNLYFVTRQISKYNRMLVKLARLYITNNNINMARYTIGILSRQSKSKAYAVEQELSYKLYRKN